MVKSGLITILLILGVVLNLSAQSEETIVHDPVIIKQNDTYYMFCTGWGIDILTSKDMKSWKREKPVFSQPPEWAKKAVEEFDGHIWAPDISYVNGLYYLYYSISSFAKNTSCIGLATNKTLDPQSPDYEWEDHGMVIHSIQGRDMWNAIDPNLIFDENGTPWMAFGSFWGGLKIVRLNKDLKSIDKENTEWHTIARRERTFDLEETDPGDGAVEAPFIIKKGDYYYLFVSFDYCCRGLNSNYKIAVGRSEKVTGPYLDKLGKRLDQGGGSILLAGDENWVGVGHNAVFTENNTDYIFFHAYDATDNGKPKLRIEKLNWDKQAWPEIKK